MYKMKNIQKDINKLHIAEQKTWVKRHNDRHYKNEIEILKNETKIEQSLIEMWDNVKDPNLTGVPKEENEGQKNLIKSYLKIFKFNENYVAMDSKSSTKSKHMKHKENCTSTLEANFSKPLIIWKS